MSADQAMETASARSRILARIRRAGAETPDAETLGAETLGAGKPGAGTPGGESAESRLATAGRQTAPRPTQSRTEGEAAIARFMDKAVQADATASRIADMGELPEALADELRQRNLPAAIRTGSDPALERDWGTVERSIGVGRLEEPATLSVARFGVAETGTLVFTSGPDNPVTLTFLGETHFAVIRAGDIVGGFEDAWAGWRDQGLDPRTTNMVTGPSRSGDIGQVLQLGAHGPVNLHIFVVG